MKKCNWVKKLLVVTTGMIGLAFAGSSANAEIISVDPDKDYKGYSNELYLDTNPAAVGMEYKTNIPSGRLTIHEKDKNVKAGTAGGWVFFGTKGKYWEHDMSINGFHKTLFPDYIAGWSSVGFDISSPTTSDYIETIHKKVGKYQGKWIDMTIRYENIQHEGLWGSGASIGTGKEDIGIKSTHAYLDVSENLTNGYVYANIKKMDISLQTVFSDTKEPVNFISDDSHHSFLSFNSLNGRYLKNLSEPDMWVSEPGNPKYPLQASEFATYLSHDTNLESTKVYVTNDTNIQHTTVPATGLTSKYFNGLTDEGFDDYLGSPTFKKNSVMFELKGKEQKFAVGAGRATAWNTYTGATLFMATPPELEEEPVKKVLNANNEDINTQQVKKNQVVKWEVSVPVGNMGATLLEKYSELKVVDNLPKEVDYNSYQVFDSKGKEITTSTTINREGQKATVSFKEDYLQNTMLYEGETYRVVFITKVKESLTGYHKIDNTATVFYNQMGLATNKVGVYVEEPVIPDPSKTVFSGSVEYNGKTVKAGQELTYEVSQKVNKQGTDIQSKYTKFNLMDKLDSKVTYKSASLLKNGTVMNNVKILSYDAAAKTVSFVADANFLSSMEMNNETYTLRIVVVVNEAVENGNEIKNKAQSIVNNSSKDTNEVKNPIFVPKESKVTKYIVNGDKQETNSSVAFEKNYQYGIDFVISDGEEITSLRLYDALEKVQTIVEAKVFDSSGKDITNQGTLDIKNATFDWKATKPDDFKGKTLKVVITAKLHNVADLEKYLNKDGVIQVPNTAKMIVNTKETPSNKVTITPPSIKNKAEKFIVK